MKPDIRWRIIRTIVALLVMAAVVASIALWHPPGSYAWFKAMHVIAVIVWMAGMIYLPRLFVYHCKAEPGSVQSETFKVMERRLLVLMINPAMIVTWGLGLWLIWDGQWLWSGWLYAKLALVIVLSGLHGYYVRWAYEFGADDNRHSQKYYRAIKDVPILLMIGIVVLAVVKPF
jgi:putative membrane protein